MSKYPFIYISSCIARSFKSPPPPPPTTTHSDTHNVPGDLLLGGLFDIGNCVTLALLAGTFDNDNKQYPDHPHPTLQ